jgi:hypothetical protein
MYPVILFAAAIMAAIVRIMIKRPASKKETAGIFLLYMIFFNIGLGGLYAFMGHVFMPDMVAREIGWPTGSPFQFEIAIANLSYGILGVLCIWIRGKFWIAVVSGSLIFLWGAAYGHFVQMEKGDTSPYNTGIFLYAGDIVIPLVIFLLMLYYFHLLKNENSVLAIPKGN